MDDLAADLGGRTAIVTGAARAHGTAVARLLADRGAIVYLVDDDLGTGDLDAAAAVAGGHAIQADATSPADVRDVVALVLAETGRIDVLVTIPRTLRDAAVRHLSPAYWAATAATHRRVMAVWSDACEPAMEASGRGRVVHVPVHPAARGTSDPALFAATTVALLTAELPVGSDEVRPGRPSR